MATELEPGDDQLNDLLLPRAYEKPHQISVQIRQIYQLDYWPGTVSSTVLSSGTQVKPAIFLYKPIYQSSYAVGVNLLFGFSFPFRWVNVQI